MKVCSYEDYHSALALASSHAYESISRFLTWPSGHWPDLPSNSSVCVSRQSCIKCDNRDSTYESTCTMTSAIRTGEVRRCGFSKS